MSSTRTSPSYPNGDVSSYALKTDPVDGDYFEFNDARGNPGSRKHRLFLDPTEDNSVLKIKDAEGRVIFASARLADYEYEHRFRSGLVVRYTFNEGMVPLVLTKVGTAQTFSATWNWLYHELSSTTDTDGTTAYDWSNHELVRITYADSSTEDWTYAGGFPTSPTDTLGNRESVSTSVQVLRAPTVAVTVWST